MSETFDVNVLVHATHRASPFHERAKALVERFLAGPGLVYLLWPVALGYLRIVTHPALLDAPLAHLPTARAPSRRGRGILADLSATGRHGLAAATWCLTPTLSRS